MANQTDEYIYHYTTMDGLKGILESGVLWLTNIKYLNDTTELHHGYEILNSLLKKRDCPEVGFTDDTYAFTASFSKDCDSLSQWRAYAKGGGVAIGFPRSAIWVEANHYRSTQFVFKDCVYSHDKIGCERILHEFLVDFNHQFQNVENEKFGGDNEDLKTFIYQNLALHYAPLIKHEAYCEEKEVRLLSKFYHEEILNHILLFDSQAKSPLKFRTQNGILKPYIEFEISNGAQSLIPEMQIVVGPNQHQCLALGSVKDFLRTKLDRNADFDSMVLPSRIPYREM